MLRGVGRYVPVRMGDPRNCHYLGGHVRPFRCYTFLLAAWSHCKDPLFVARMEKEISQCHGIHFDGSRFEVGETLTFSSISSLFLSKSYRLASSPYVLSTDEPT